MIKEKEILNLVKKNNGIITTKTITMYNIPRIYLTKLTRENKLYRIARGIYSTEKIIVDPYFKMQNDSKKIIFSHFTSLKIQGIYKNIDKTAHISVPQGYNAKKFNNQKVFYNSLKSYKAGMINYMYNGHNIKIYDLERTVCDIIKDHSRFEEIEYNKFINYYFNKTNLNYKKLLEYSKVLRISKIVHHYLSLFKA